MDRKKPALWQVSFFCIPNNLDFYRDGEYHKEVQFCKKEDSHASHYSFKICTAPLRAYRIGLYFQYIGIHAHRAAH